MEMKSTRWTFKDAVEAAVNMAQREEHDVNVWEGPGSYYYVVLAPKVGEKGEVLRAAVDPAGGVKLKGKDRVPWAKLRRSRGIF